MRGAEDFILVLLQNVDPRAHIRGVLLGVVRDTAVSGEKDAGKFRPEFFLGIARIAESVAFVERLPIQPTGMARPMRQLMQS